MMKAELWSGRVPVRVVQWDGRSEEIYTAEHSLPRVDLDLSPEVPLEPTFRRRIFRRDHSAQGFVFREVGEQTMPYDFRPRVGETTVEMFVRLQSYAVSLGGRVELLSGRFGNFPYRVCCIVPVTEDGQAYSVSGELYEVLAHDTFRQNFDLAHAPVRNSAGWWIPGDPDTAAAVLRRDDYGQDEADGAACRAMANALRAR